MSQFKLERGCVLSDSRDANVHHRILWIDELEGKQLRCVIIRISHKLEMPVWMNVPDVQRLLDAGDWKPVDYNPFRFTFHNEGDLPEDVEKRRIYVAIKEQRHEAVQAVVKLGRDAFFPSLRARRVDEICSMPDQREDKSGAIKRQSVRDALILYWQSGGVPAALYPRFTLRGRKSLAEKFKEMEDAGDTAVVVKRPGRRRTRKDDNGSLGCDLTAGDWQNLVKGASEFLFVRRAEERGRGLPWRRALRETLAKYFDDMVIKTTDETGRTMEVTKKRPSVNRPTLQQFKTAARSHRDIAQKLTALGGSRDFQTNQRPVSSDSREMAEHPGALFQIDWMLADIWLVSELDRRTPVGRPFVYFVLDTFSRIVTGVYTTFEYPSYRTGAMALLEAMSPKPEFAKRYGVDLALGQWDCEHVPDMVIHDGGELASRLGDHVPTEVSDLATAPPYRPDLKGVVERSFRIAGVETIQWLDGSVWKPGIEDAPDPTKTCALTLTEFTRLIIRLVVDVMNPRWISKKALPIEAHHDGIGACPNDLWKWGRQRMSGALGKRPRHQLLPGLLPREMATVVPRKGLNLNGVVFFREDLPDLQELISRAAPQIKGVNAQEVQVAYDPNSTAEVFLVGQHGRFDRIPLSKVSQEYSGLTFREVKAANKRLRDLQDQQSEARAERRERAQSENRKDSDAARAATAAAHASGADGKKTTAELKSLEIAVGQAKEALANQPAAVPAGGGEKISESKKEEAPPKPPTQPRGLPARFARMMEHAQQAQQASKAGEEK